MRADIRPESTPLETASSRHANELPALFVYSVGAAFWIALTAALALRPDALSQLPKLALLLGLAIAGEELVVRQRERSEASVLSFSVLAHVAAAVVLGPVGAALVAALGVVVVDGLRGESRKLVAVNSSMFGGSIWLAAELFRLAGGSQESMDLRALPALAVLILTRYLATSFVLALGSALAQSQSVLPLFKGVLLEELGATLGEGSLGVLVAFGLADGHHGMLPFLAPLLAALYTSKSTFQRLKQETGDALRSVAQLVDARDTNTAEHTKRVAAYVERFAEAIRLPERETERLVAAARLHDLGKIAVDVETLRKRERLSEDELRAIRRHPRLSAHLLHLSHFAHEMALYVELHHERYDGRGYYAVPPSEIPIEAHVLIVADCFDAMTSERPYRPALPVDEAAKEIRDKAGTQFHPLVARAFAALVLGEDAEAELGPADMALLQSSFSRVRLVPVAPAEPLLRPRTLTLGFGAASLIFYGFSLPLEVAAAAALASLVSAAWWSVAAARLGDRTRRALAAIKSGAEPAAALETAGMPGWVAWLRPEAGLDVYRPVGGLSGDLSAGDLREACNWALRREDELRATLSSGTYLVLSAARYDQARLALGLSRAPSSAEEAILELVVERLLEGPKLPGPARPPSLKLVPSIERRRSPVGGSATLLVDLGVFEGVRKAAGQLLARQVIGDAETRLRELLRETDTVVRIGDDRFAISLLVADRESLDPICDRIRRELERLPIPRDLMEVRPQIVAAFGTEIRAHSELAAVEKLLAASVETSAAAR